MTRGPARQPAAALRHIRGSFFVIALHLPRRRRICGPYLWMDFFRRRRSDAAARSIGNLLTFVCVGGSVRAYLLGALVFSVRVSQRECFVAGRPGRGCLGSRRGSQAGWFRPGWIWRRLGARALVVVVRVEASSGSRALRDGWPAPPAGPGIGDRRVSWVDLVVGTAGGPGPPGRSGPGWS